MIKTGLRPFTEKNCVCNHFANAYANVTMKTFLGNHIKHQREMFFFCLQIPEIHVLANITVTFTFFIPACFSCYPKRQDIKLDTQYMGYNKDTLRKTITTTRYYSFTKSCCKERGENSLIMIIFGLFEIYLDVIKVVKGF